MSIEECANSRHQMQTRERDCLHDSQPAFQSRAGASGRGFRFVRIGGAAPVNAVTYDLAALRVVPWIDTHVHTVNHFDSSNRLAGSDEPVSQAAWRLAENV